MAFLVTTGVFRLFARFRCRRQREGIPDQLTLRVLLTAVLLRCPSIRKIPEVLFTDHGVLRFLGFNAHTLAAGLNRRRGDGKELPLSHETVYDLRFR